MQFEVGKIYEGTVKGITQYGAFVELDSKTTGMVHISEIANAYVSDIKEHLKENQQVKVMILGVNEAGKISLSIKKALPPEEKKDFHSQGGGQRRFQNGDRPQGRYNNNNNGGGGGNYNRGPQGQNGGQQGGQGGGGQRQGGQYQGGGQRYQPRQPQASNVPPQKYVWESKKTQNNADLSFEEMMSKFKQNSEEKICDLKKNVENKRRSSSRKGGSK